MSDNPGIGHNQPPASASELVAEALRIEDWMASEAKRFAEYMKPHKERVETIKNQLLEKLNAEGADNFKTEHGTAYKSHLLNIKIEDRNQLIDFCNDKWEECGSDMLMVSAQKDAVKNWMDANNGVPPPGISTSWFTRLNIRRS